MKLSRVEMETIILYNEADDTANVYTHDPRLISKLEQLAMRNPALFQMPFVFSRMNPPPSS